MSDYEKDFEDYDDDPFEDEIEAPERGTLADDNSTSHDRWAHAPHQSLPSDSGTPVSPGSLLDHCKDGILSLLGTPKREQGQQERSVVTLNADAAPSEAEKAKALKRLARSQRLMAKVTLTEVSTPEMLNMAPLSDYEMLSQGKGPFAKTQTGSTQTGVQNQDVLECDAQTDEIDVKEASCQAADDPTTSSESAAANRHDIGSHDSSSSPMTLQGKVMAAASRLVTQDNGLFSFLHWAGPLMSQELGREGGSDAAQASSEAAAFQVASGHASSICSGSLELSLPELLEGRRLVAMCHEPEEAAAPGAAGASGLTNSSSSSRGDSKTSGGAAAGGVLLCCAYAPVSMPADQLLKEHGLAGCSVMMVWDTGRPSKPQHLLVCEGVITCCCWGVYPCASAIFAGTEEGAICSWDLSELSSHHPQEQLPSNSNGSSSSNKATAIAGRRPAHTTEASALDADSSEPLVAVAAAHRKGGGPGTPASRLGCLLVGLTARGRVRVFSVLLLEGDSGGGAQPDVGMRPGSRVYLLATQEQLPLGLLAAQPSHLRPPVSQWPVLAARALQLLPGESPQLLVGANRGKVLRGALLGVPSAPRELLPLSMAEVSRGASLNPYGPGGSRCTAVHGQVVGLHLSPLLPDVLLSAHEGGTIMLHSLSKAHAVCSWSEVSAHPIVGLRWLPGRPCMFLALDANNTLFIFDLLGAQGQQAQAVTLQAPAAATAAAAAAGAGGGQPVVPCCFWSADSAGALGSSPEQGGSLLGRRMEARQQAGGAAAAGAAGGEGSAAAAGGVQWFAVGYSNGSALVFRLADGLHKSRPKELERLKGLLVQ